MNILARLLWMPFDERVVDDAMIPSLAGCLSSFVKAQGLARVHLSDELLDDLLAEAIARSELIEPVGRPNYRELWQKIEEVADATARVYKGYQDQDLAVESILRRHGLTKTDLTKDNPIEN